MTRGVWDARSFFRKGGSVNQAHGADYDHADVNHAWGYGGRDETPTCRRPRTYIYMPGEFSDVLNLIEQIISSTMPVGMIAVVTLSAVRADTDAGA